MMKRFKTSFLVIFISTIATVTSQASAGWEDEIPHKITTSTSLPIVKGQINSGEIYKNIISSIPSKEEIRKYFHKSEKTDFLTRICDFRLEYFYGQIEGIFDILKVLLDKDYISDLEHSDILEKIHELVNTVKQMYEWQYSDSVLQLDLDVNYEDIEKNFEVEQSTEETTDITENDNNFSGLDTLDIEIPELDTLGLESPIDTLCRKRRIAEFNCKIDSITNTLSKMRKDKSKTFYKYRLVELYKKSKISDIDVSDIIRNLNSEIDSIVKRKNYIHSKFHKQSE